MTESDLSAQEHVVMRALRLLEALREPILAAYLGMPLHKLRPLCRSLEDRDYIVCATRNPIRWSLTDKGRQALDQGTGAGKGEEGDSNG